MLDLVNLLTDCGPIKDVPDVVFNVTSLIVKAIQIVVPILLIIWGMIDFAKAVIGQDEDKIKAGQKIFIKRIIAAVIAFLVVTIVQLIVNLVGSATDGDEFDQTDNAWSCAKMLINGK